MVKSLKLSHESSRARWDYCSSANKDNESQRVPAMFVVAELGAKGGGAESGRLPPRWVLTHHMTLPSRDSGSP